jgi:hypothetical protein
LTQAKNTVYQLQVVGTGGAAAAIAAAGVNSVNTVSASNQVAVGLWASVVGETTAKAKKVAT